MWVDDIAWNTWTSIKSSIKSIKSSSQQRMSVTSIRENDGTKYAITNDKHIIQQWRSPVVMLELRAKAALKPFSPSTVILFRPIMLQHNETGTHTGAQSYYTLHVEKHTVNTHFNLQALHWLWLSWILRHRSNLSIHRPWLDQYLGVSN